MTTASRARDNHVDFGANAEVVEVQARFDCEAGARQQPPVVVRLVVVHVDAVAVDRFAEAVTGPVQDVFAVPGAAQHRRGGAVDLPAREVPGRPRPRPLHERHRRIARRGDGVKRRPYRSGRARPYSPPR